MRKIRIAAAAVAVVCAMGFASALEHDIHDLQARIAEHEERINDYHAKLGEKSGEEGPENIISMRKNAKVTIGGLVNTKHTYTRAKIDSRYNVEGSFDDDYRRRATWKGGNLEVADAELHMEIEVNDNFEAAISLDLHNGTEDDYWNTEVYYIRWKNLCDTGFGLKIGRDQLTFGADGVGELASYAAGSGDGLGELDDDFVVFTGLHSNAMGRGGPAVAFGGIVPVHNGWDVSGVTQVTPYWEGLDGALSFELSLMTNVYEDRAHVSNPSYMRDRRGVSRYRSRSYGLGTFSARASYEPVEDLKFVASFANYRSNGKGDDDEYTSAEYKTFLTRNNTVWGLAASYRPCFFKDLEIWAQWVHGNNVHFYRDTTSDAVNFGASYDILENLTLFAQGDYLRTTYKQNEDNSKGTAWAFYTGLQYSLPYGVSFEAGWKHEKITYKSHGERMGRAKGDSIYAMAGFEF